MTEYSSPQTVNSAETVHSSVRSVQVVDSSTSSVQVFMPAMPAIQDYVETVDSSYRSATVEHVISSPRDSISSVELDVLEARAEATRAAQQAAEARLRYLEARARSSRTSRASRSSRDGDLERWERALDPRIQAAPALGDHVDAENFVLPTTDVGAGVGPLDAPEPRARHERDRARRPHDDRMPPRQEPRHEADHRDDPVRLELEALRRRNMELEKIVSASAARHS